MLKLLITIVIEAWFVQAIKNPIIPGWNPDAAILRDGNSYFIATSSFEYFPGTPIHHSKDLANWSLFSHAQVNAKQVQLYGVPTGAGVWAPSLTKINGVYYLASMSRWVYDPMDRLWPRVVFYKSRDMVNWSDPVWCEPWGIDPSLFQDPMTKKTYLNLMAPNNNVDRLWGIYQCEVDLTTGDCVGDSYRSLWNGTLPQTADTRAEGPKMYYRQGYYYLLIAEGGTDAMHRSTIARSRSPEGPWDPAPNNPLMYNGGANTESRNLTVQSTGHATFVETPTGSWYASFIARRNINGYSPLGREGFLTTVDWQDGWPILNQGKPIMLSESFGEAPDQSRLANFEDDFSAATLGETWYQLRNPYTSNFEVQAAKSEKGCQYGSGIALKPNVYGLSDRDTPSAILRKQLSTNMTFSATLLSSSTRLNTRQSVGISAYLSEFQHQDIGVSGCSNSTGMCIFSSLIRNTTVTRKEVPLDILTDGGGGIPRDLTLHIRAEPLRYTLGYSLGVGTNTEKTAINWMSEIESSWLAFAPADYFVFSGASFALFASGGGEPWPKGGSAVGFTRVHEEYYIEDLPDYDEWDT